MDCSKCKAPGMCICELEPFPAPARNDGGEPCGECHLKPGETCDICGAVNNAPSEPPGDGWQPWIDDHGRPTGAERHALIEVWRDTFGNTTAFWRPAEIDPHVNIHGVFWRVA